MQNVWYNLVTLLYGATVYAEVKRRLFSPNMSLWLCAGFALLLIGELYHGVSSVRTLGKWVVPSGHSLVAAAVSTKLVHPGLTTSFFGDYVPVRLDEAGVKQSLLNLTVVGIMYSSEEALSQVIIRTEPLHEEAFWVGDTLPGGGVIKRITRDGVLMRRQGSLERLTLPKNELRFEASPKPLIGE